MYKGSPMPRLTRLVLALVVITIAATAPSAGANTWVVGLDDPDPDVLRVVTPFYRAEVHRDPMRIVSVEWDINGRGEYRQAIVEELPGTQWKSTLYAGVGGFTDTFAGAAGQIVRHPDGRTATFADIPLAEGLAADWTFTFRPDRIEHEIMWHAASDQSALFNLGHQIVTAMGVAGDEVERVRRGDVDGFSRYTQAYDEDRVIRETFVEDSTPLQGNRFFNGLGFLWQNVFPGKAQLGAGTTSGGRFIIRGMHPDEAWVRSNSNRIGHFAPADEYMKDFTFLKHDGVWHLFYNVGDAGPVQDWQQPENEKAFGHATSTDLVNWTMHPRVMHAVPGTWEGMVVSAPVIRKIDDTWHMLYTGFDSDVVGLQRNGLATSTDLFTWTRHPANPVSIGPDWTTGDLTRWWDYRDPDLLWHEGAWLQFNPVHDRNVGRYAISIQRSTDMVTWEDLGPAKGMYKDGVMESAQVFERDGTYWMLNSATGMSLWRTDDPVDGTWEEVPFEFPERGFWAGWEIYQDGDQWIAAAFEWKLYGNYITFWELQWIDGLPVVRY